MREAFLPVRAVPALIGGAIAAALCIAWLAQYGFGLKPCELCLWQRYVYGVALFVSLAAVFGGRTARGRRLWLLLLAGCLLSEAAVALFHVGVEYRWWEGTSACVGAVPAGPNVADTLSAIETAPLVRCDQPAFQLFGLSMAFYNMVYAIGLAALVAWSARKA
ncbi:MAG TPA: disulfide bond formation protein B [Dongiaceae bacterium]|jgi:disulfide bond formation protein DsbB|nr:disulfide bond formation protein B [Dongiaceae bacterium]